MKILPLHPAHVDHRGSITDLLSEIDITSVALITFVEGAVRANHYHKKTIQWNFIIEGEVLIATQFPGEKISEKILKPGDFVMTVENESHALKALMNSKVLILTKGPRSGQNYEEDTYRLDHPLI